MKSLVPFLALSVVAAHAETFSFHHENVLGTSLELRVSADSEATARQAEASVLAEIDRLTAVLNTWSNDSEISRWQASGKTAVVSADLAAVLKACDQWAADSEGAFSVRVKASAADMGTPAWTLDGTTATFTAKAGGITVDALAKGYIIDRAVEKAAGVTGIALNIGGDLRVTGEQSIMIADPRDDAENAAPLATVTLRDQALATSGDYRRGNHIIDPRSGKPATHIASASVIAPDATTADALATIFNVLQPSESLAMADAMPGVSCLIVSHDGGVFRSRAWREDRQQNMLVAADAAPAFEMKVDFELDKPEAERYLRPYVAIWIEDKDDFPVRTLSLWLLKGEKGLRWLPDLKRWNRSDKTRRLADTTDIVPLITSATRNPGKYSVTWDGLDDNKKALPAGEYTLYIEAAREKGTYQIIKHPFKVGEAFTKDLGGNVEIKSASVDYQPKAAAN
ncbi:DUF2271 domain-containing protein [Luteolibacter sp. SL250]|uniref:DUF2271 domain-containing protein n=1 Tax=Luteolibacter sp. SL250 TaxID=2995170 RepID=UPI002270A2B1|nr:DUF2271 domain-containing protein [Luteolibacter sp. SL250]WAC19935.1 DUF2271 domain-containing protein [Luteolibacter sp. SL250]